MTLWLVGIFSRSVDGLVVGTEESDGDCRECGLEGLMGLWKLKESLDEEEMIYSVLQETTRSLLSLKYCERLKSSVSPAYSIVESASVTPSR